MYCSVTYGNGNVLQGWTERAVFGKVRYMNYNGCKRKFDVQKYIDLVKEKVEELHKMRGDK